MMAFFLTEGVRKWICRFRILLSHLRFFSFVRSAFQIKTQLPRRQLAQG
jgi:hypothetical protein